MRFRKLADRGGSAEAPHSAVTEQERDGTPRDRSGVRTRRVLLVSNHGWTVFNFRRGLIEGLEGRAHEVYVQTEFDGYERQLQLNPDHILPLYIDRCGINPVHDLLTIRSIYRAIGRVRADVCLFFTIKPTVYGSIAAVMRGKPYICNVTGLGTAFLSRAWLRWIAKVLFRIALVNAERVFFQNREDLRSFISERIVETERSDLLPGSGVDLSRFAPVPYPTNAAPVFLLIARLIWDKGVGEFVEAARTVKRRYPDARFQILGPVGVMNPAAISMEQVAAWVRERAIEYLGETDNVAPFIASADCVVLPSYYREGVPRTLLEAAAMARPVIAADNVGCRDAVEDGLTGLLCRARDARDLASTIERMIGMSREERVQMGRHGREKMEREFDECVVIDRYIAAIADAVHVEGEELRRKRVMTARAGSGRKSAQF